VDERYSPYPRFLGRVALIDLVTFIVAGVVSWSIGWHTLDHYHGAVVEGTILIALRPLRFGRNGIPSEDSPLCTPC
jgi:hypothetical protein